MELPIKHKRGTTIPTAGDLVVGEIAINTATGLCYTKTGAGNVVAIGLDVAANWGNIGGTLSSQTDLQNALNLKADLSGATFSGVIRTPEIRNLLNTDLVVDSYNDTGAGVHYEHKFTHLDGNFVLATNGGGLTFPDGTIQTTASTTTDLTGYATEAFVTTQGYVNSFDLTAYASLSGATFTGKVSLAPSATTAGLNVGTYASGVAPTVPLDGDVWISDNLNYKNQAGAVRTVLNTTTTGVVTIAGSQNTLTLNQLGTGGGLVVTAGVSSSQPAVRITQTGPGEALRVEDESPESTPFVVSSDGRVGIHGTPATNTAHKLAIYNGNIVFSTGFGLAFGDGTTQTTASTTFNPTGYAQKNSGNTFTQPQVIATNSSTASLRITNTGNSHSLVVEDNTNPDSTAFIVATNGAVGIGKDPANFTINNVVVLDVSGTAVFTSPVTSTRPPLGIGTIASNPTTAVSGDIWHIAGSDRLNFKDSTAGFASRVLANTNSVNNFTFNQTITSNSNTTSTPALRIASTGNQPALVVEDAVSPDTSATVIDQFGNVGIGVASAFTATQKLEVVGSIKTNSIIFSPDTNEFKVDSLVSSEDGNGGTIFHLLVSYGGSTYRVPMEYVSTP